MADTEDCAVNREGMDVREILDFFMGTPQKHSVLIMDIMNHCIAIVLSSLLVLLLGTGSAW